MSFHFHIFKVFEGFFQRLFDFVFLIDELLRYGYLELRAAFVLSYHRLDIGVKRKFSLGRRSILELNLGATNVYSRQNIFYFNRTTFERVNQLPILASFGASLTF